MHSLKSSQSTTIQQNYLTCNVVTLSAAAPAADAKDTAMGEAAGEEDEDDLLAKACCISFHCLVD